MAKLSSNQRRIDDGGKKLRELLDGSSSVDELLRKLELFGVGLQQYDPSPIKDILDLRSGQQDPSEPYDTRPTLGAQLSNKIRELATELTKKINSADDPVNSQNQISKLLRLNAALLSEHKTGGAPAILERTLANAWLGCANVQKKRDNRDGQMDALAWAFEFGAQFNNVAQSWRQANPDKKDPDAAYRYFYEQGLERLRRGEPLLYILLPKWCTSAD